jgi:hypothetical protein
MKESNRWARTSLVLLFVGCALAGFLAGSSSSQDTRRSSESTEVGRYQWVNDVKIFDTKTARLWRVSDQGWVFEDSPWEANQREKPEKTTRLPRRP